MIPCPFAGCTGEVVKGLDNRHHCSTCQRCVGVEEMAAEVARLRAGLRHIAETCIQEPDIAQFADANWETVLGSDAMRRLRQRRAERESRARLGHWQLPSGPRGYKLFR